MSQTHRPDERGIALVLALFAMVIATLMITAVFYVARQEQRTGNNRIATTQAQEAAEAGLAAVMANWNIGTYNAMATGSSLTLPQTTVGGRASYAGSLRRMTPTTFLIQVEGRYQIGGQTITRRQLVKLARLNQPSINMHAAVTTRVGISVSGSARVSGVDSVPASWGASCPSPGPSQPGIRDSSGNVTTSGACSGASCIAGSPRILTDPTVNSGTFNQFGDLNFAQLAAMANKVVSGTMTGIGPTTNLGPPVSCRTGDIANWGDPLHPAGTCGGYFPIIYAPGDVRLSGGQGQGILLVGGNLDIAGGMEFYGPVIVQGQVRSTGTGGHFYGGLMAANAGGLLSGNSVVNFSSCAINRAMQGLSRVKSLGERSWAQAY